MTYIVSGIVLSQADYRDYDKKFTILTFEHGKISAIATGAKKITSKLNSHLEFFALTKLMIADGKRVKRIAGAQMVHSFKNIKTDIEKTVIALYLLETVDLLVRYDFSEELVFKIVKKFFFDLDSCDNRRDGLLALNKYLFELLSCLGYQPDIKSSKQKGLIGQFNKLIMEISDREVKSYRLLSKLFD
jgi:DNA repair protein RecO (recombination protein O)